MRIALSLLSKLLGAIAGVLSLGFLARRSMGSSGGGTSGGAPPQDRPRSGDSEPRDTYALDPEQRDIYALDLPTHGEPMRPGWSRPAPLKIPHPTYWPMIFGLGVAFLMWGFISNLFVLGLGFFFMMVALVGWVKDLLHEFIDY